jgi:hypothetical protein
LSRLDKKWFINFLLSNLNDVDLASPTDQQLPVYDQTEGKWKNKGSDAFLNLNKNEFLEKVTVPGSTNAIMLRPIFTGDIEVEGGGCLELLG